MSTGLPAAAAAAGRPDTAWYGMQPWWQIPVEGVARREHGRDLCATVERDLLSYRVPLEVRGRRNPVPVTIYFFAQPTYPCWGLSPEEYPRVFADPGRPSPHRMPDDDALCLYYPWSPPEQRWRPQDGLLALLDLTCVHLFFEDHWWATGGRRDGEWLGDEQPHGFPRRAA
ncbi:hypothetical protein [Blastococcus tunisiensis]|uniref:Uncharacterized protein n=1 Tax=Blastococcus tunisiensis TaxID=1798228 RepID=A0A1I2K687_9ACTN|nr:hypothetical protein [Blastococcus sp. DSM 46838]SFF61680.1 hypothetical protein SAMN05216574_11959 [Blastococcus sp. DSM 46838]